jgi:hypothetical protein
MLRAQQVTLERTATGPVPNCLTFQRRLASLDEEQIAM